ncbi:MAG: radical SAM protein, partial [Chitinophagaceae bacterium]|nr:radical SAM protein [Chitinophagaceae bacterium]
MTTSKVLLITPPFTQLNTPYPATAYIKGFLNTQNVASHQADIGIEVINAIFCHSGLASLFAHIAQQGQVYSGNTARIIALAPLYLKTINTVMDFLHHKNPMLAQLICTGNFLPEAARFQQVADLDWAFGAMGIQDKARHLATLYIEDLSDLIIATTDPYFGFSRYAERLSSAAHTFDELHAALCQPNSYIDNITLQILANKIHTQQPTLVAISAPFPGNMYSALRCGLYIKQHYPHIKVCLGG